MVDLKTLQQDMSSMILGAEPSGALLTSIVKTPMAASDRLQIHKNNFKLTLSSALMDVFPVIMSFVGEQWLEAALKKFAVQYPPSEACLSSYGGEFADFLDSFAPAVRLPYLADLARVEWAIHMCQNAKDEMTLKPADWANLVKTDMQSLSFSLVAAHKFIESDYPLLDLWNVGTGTDTSSEINLEAGGTTLLVIRPQSEVLIFPLDMNECRFLSSMNKGETVLSSATAVGWAHESSPLAENMSKYVDNKFFTVDHG